VILPIEKAEALFRWAEPGTPVLVVEQALSRETGLSTFGPALGNLKVLFRQAVRATED
jgi:hypothetical protein